MAETSSKSPKEIQTIATINPSSSEKARAELIQVRNRRKRYLDLNLTYFSPALELADPLLYDRLIRRFQTPAEREAEGRKKGFSGTLQADLYRSEAKVAALANPDLEAPISYRRGPNGEILEEDRDEVPRSKEEGWDWWKHAMEMRFVAGRDDDFDYAKVDESEEWDDRGEEDRLALEEYLQNEEPEFIRLAGEPLQGETGVQDY